MLPAPLEPPTALPGSPAVLVAATTRMIRWWLSARTILRRQAAWGPRSRLVVWTWRGAGSRGGFSVAAASAQEQRGYDSGAWRSAEVEERVKTAGPVGETGRGDGAAQRVCVGEGEVENNGSGGICDAGFSPEVRV